MRSAQGGGHHALTADRRELAEALVARSRAASTHAGSGSTVLRRRAPTGSRSVMSAPRPAVHAGDEGGAEGGALGDGGDARRGGRCSRPAPASSAGPACRRRWPRCAWARGRPRREVEVVADHEAGRLVGGPQQVGGLVVQGQRRAARPGGRAGAGACARRGRTAATPAGRPGATASSSSGSASRPSQRRARSRNRPPALLGPPMRLRPAAGVRDRPEPGDLAPTRRARPR